MARGGRPICPSRMATLLSSVLEAGARNISMGQLLTDIMSKAIKKNMIEEILREPSQEPAPEAEDA